MSECPKPEGSPGAPGFIQSFVLRASFVIRALSFVLSWSELRLINSRLKKHPAGVEPALPPWQGSTLPLHNGCVLVLVELSKSKESRRSGEQVIAGEPLCCPHFLRWAARCLLSCSPVPLLSCSLSAGPAERSTGWESNPRFRITGAESWPLNDPCLSSNLFTSKQVGPEGLEPSPTWLRARHAAANTWIPCIQFEWGRRDSNPRLAD